MPATTESIALPHGAASFPGALRDARSETSQRRIVLEATALAAALAAVYLIVSPRTADLAAHVFRVGLFEREGPSIWNAAWYGGHHLPSYSLLFPPLGAVLGVRLAGALCAVAAGALFAALAHGRYGTRARVPALMLAITASANLWAARMPFALGIALGLAALLALQRERGAWAIFLAAATSVASPVAGLFLALAGVALALAGRPRAGLGLALAAFLPAALLAAAFPEGGSFPFAGLAFWSTIAFALAGLATVPREERALRAGLALYAAGALVAFVLPTPMGGNTVRLGMVLGGPALACALVGRRPWVLALLTLPLLYWPIAPVVRDVADASGDPSTQRAYYVPLLERLGPEARNARLEIPLTRDHWEATWVASRVPLARGWERQLDRRFNPVFYDRPLTLARYRAWLRNMAISYVALPDAPLDYSSRAEARLLRAGVPGLHLVWRSRHWRLYAARPAPHMVEGPGRLLSVGADRFAVAARRPGRLLVRIRFTPYWSIERGTGCVAKGPGGWTQLRLRRPGRVLVVTDFDAARVFSRGPRCTA